jgi:hypothetical protein
MSEELIDDIELKEAEPVDGSFLDRNERIVQKLGD